MAYIVRKCRTLSRLFFTASVALLCDESPLAQMAMAVSLTSCRGIGGYDT